MQPEDRGPLRSAANVAGSVGSLIRAHGDEPKLEDVQWNALLEWLACEHGMDTGQSGLMVERRDVEGAGKGLFAIKSCPPSSTLFTIPSTAMINVKTLTKLYGLSAAARASLTATQLIAMHLLLHRPGEDGVSRDPAFGPYISTMPQNFDTHPATWSVRQQFGLASPTEEGLLTLLPPSVSLALDKQTRIFTTDWTNVVKYIAANPTLVRRSSRPGLSLGDFHAHNTALVEDFLWAWLTVNTRCIYYQLNPSRAAPENLTLCPVLDFANHAPEETHILPVLPSAIFPPTPGSSTQANGSIGGDYMFIASSTIPVRKDEELFLRYGGHANRTLFVEYGFINSWTTGDCVNGKFSCEVDVQDLLEDILANKGVPAQRLREILEDAGYWGDWTIHSLPSPAHPSYRLVPALRLFHAVPVGSSESTFADVCESWRSVLMGQAEFLSTENEKSWRETLLQVCSKISERATPAIASCVSRCESLMAAGNSDWVERNIELLWREEQEVAEAVAESVRAGNEFT